MNSVVQVLHKIPELEESVLGFEGGEDTNHPSGTPQSLVHQLKLTFEQLDSSRSAVRPISLVTVFVCAPIYC